MKLRSFVLIVAAMAAGCMDKVEPGKGEIVEESPPGTPLPGPSEGKSDGEGTRATLSIESAHPYTNNLDQTFPVELAGRVPGCATYARLHFATLRTEARYDFVHVEGPFGSQSFDGTHDNTWTEWFELDGSLSLAVRLETDYSIVRDGFRIDSVEVQTNVLCPAIAIRRCDDDQLDTNASRGTCECPRQPTCVADGDVSIEHAIGGGFTGQVNGHRAVGTAAYDVVYRPGEETRVTQIGTIDHERLQTALRAIVDAGLTSRPDVSEVSNWNETFQIAVAGALHTFTRPQGSFPTADAQAIAAFESLFVCGTGGALTCGAGFACDNGACVEEASCVCPALYQPVCGQDGRTYSNACAAGCADMPVVHDGECGIDGDPCGGPNDLDCQGRCRYAPSTWNPPFEDASGVCRGYDYCDAPVDCGWLVRPAGPGSWTCEANTCNWNPETAWQDFTGFRFQTTHPYANNASDWRQVYLPAGAQKMRLLAAGTFDLERNYDWLEVYAWQNNNWVRVKRYTGTTPPSSTDELTGQYFYLRLATDSSIVRYGFDLTVQYAN